MMFISGVLKKGIHSYEQRKNTVDLDMRFGNPVDPCPAEPIMLAEKP